MTRSALLRAVQNQLRRGEGSTGLCIVFTGLVWGTLVGGLLANGPVWQALTVGAGVLLGTLLFASREFVLARAVRADAQA